MYSIFNKINKENTGIIKPPEFELVKRVYTEQINDIIEYYKNRNIIVHNTHLLCRMLNLFMPSLSYSIEEFISIIYTRSPFIAKHFKLTSEIEYGNIFKDIFYQGDQLLIYSEDYFNINDAIENWKDIQAVKVLKHPISSLKFLLPNPTKYPTTESGLSIISINLPMLLIQYREFLHRQLLKPDGERSGVQAFIGRYVLPNMLYSHADICIFNRVYNQWYNIPNIDIEPSKHPILIIDYSKRVDNITKIIIKHITNRQLPYHAYLKHIPSVFSENSEEALIMPNLVKTRQDWWALYLSRLDEICFLLDIGGTTGISRNRELIMKAKIDVQRLLRDNIYETRLPRSILNNVYIKLEKILQI